MLRSMQAADEFADVIPGFRKAWKLAWADMLAKYNEPLWDNRVRSNVIQMQAVIHALDIFRDNPEVRHEQIDQRHVFIVRDGLFRLKQIDESHCSSNYETVAARLYDSMQPLPGFRDLQRLTIGLMPDANWTNYIGIYLTFPNGLRVRPSWVLDITGEPVDIEVLQTEFNEPTIQPERRFKPKRQQSEERADGAGV